MVKERVKKWSVLVKNNMQLDAAPPVRRFHVTKDDLFRLLSSLLR